MTHFIADTSFRRIVVVHGFGATVTDHWFPWLADTVSGVELVALPDPLTPRADAWVPIVASAIGTLTPDTAVVAHSLGCLTSVLAVEAVAGPDDRLGCFIAVAPFATMLPTIGDPDLDAFIRDGLADFVDNAHMSVARDVIERREVVRSDDDPIVPATAGDAFAAQLDAPVHLIAGAGHFLGVQGVDRLDMVVDLLSEP